MKIIKIVFNLFGLAIMAGSVFFACHRADAQSAAGMLALDTHGILGTDSGPSYNQSANMDATGAMGANMNLQPGQVWYVEEQRGCIYSARGAAILALQKSPSASTVAYKTQLVAQTESAINWAFARQNADGSFSMPSSVPLGRQIHSTAMFIEACAHSLLLWQATKIDSSFVKKTTPKLVNAALWLAKSAPVSSNAVAANQQAAVAYDYGHAHRNYEKAAALMETALVSPANAKALSGASDSYINVALSTNTAVNPVTQLLGGVYDTGALGAPSSETVPLVGVNPENDSPTLTRPLSDSYDSSYQALGLYYALLYAETTNNVNLRTGVLAMALTGLDWEASRIGSDGEADLTGNTRVTASASDETAPDGTPKAFTYVTATFAFGYGSALMTGYTDGDTVALSLAEELGWAH